MDPKPQINVIRPKGGFSLPKLPKFNPVMIVVATVILALVSVISAILLYQKKQEPVAPNVGVPSRAAEGTACVTNFTISASPTPIPTPTPSGSPIPTPTPTPTPSESPTPTPTPTPGEPNSCGGTCGSNYNCQSGLFCYQGFCRNPNNPTSVTCAGTTPSPTPTSTPRTVVGPTPTPVALQQAGSVAGTWTVSIAGAVLLILGSVVMFAL